jgi:hypothetical protein
MQSQTNPTTRRKLPTGIIERHSTKCRLRAGGRCNCDPGYRAWVYDTRSHQKIVKGFPTIAAAKKWRTDAASAVQRGKLSPPSKRSLREAWEEWHTAATTEPPTILTRSGRRAYAWSPLRIGGALLGQCCGMAPGR